MGHIALLKLSYLLFKGGYLQPQLWTVFAFNVLLVLFVSTEIIVISFPYYSLCLNYVLIDLFFQLLKLFIVFNFLAHYCFRMSQILC